MTCDPGPDRAPFNPYDEPRTLTGANGVFADSCDANGNLVNHQCEASQVRCPGGKPHGHVKRAQAPCWQRSGSVTSDTIDCDGRCSHGACATRCPQEGDQLTIIKVDAQGTQLVFENAADPRHIACTLAWDDKQDAFDCKSARPGDTTFVHGRGLSTTMCTGGVWGAIGDGRCSWRDCRYLP